MASQRQGAPPWMQGIFHRELNSTPVAEAHRLGTPGYGDSDPLPLPGIWDVKIGRQTDVEMRFYVLKVTVM